MRDTDGEALKPIPTPESKRPALPSVYAISKYHQERLCMTVGRAYNIPTVGLRFFNIFGTRQALSNPYTGVLAIFASRYLNGHPPLINEDGAAAARLRARARHRPGLPPFPHQQGRGPGRSSISAAAILIRFWSWPQRMGEVLGKEHLEPEITGRYRMGDIRNCFADISLARREIGYEPKVTLEEGLGELAEWLEGQTAVDRVADASRELAARGLTV